jgi:hypothetical protein
MAAMEMKRSDTKKFNEEGVSPKLAEIYDPNILYTSWGAH